MGFPIRKSPDLSLFSGFPKLIAASHVLHRLLVPRHPPYALNNLIIAKFYILACGESLLIQFSKSGLLHYLWNAFQLRSGISYVQFSRLGFYAKVVPGYLVEVNGLEPMTSCLQSRRSPS